MGGAILASTIVGAAIVGAALIHRGGQEYARFAMQRSGFNNTVWVLDQATGALTYCGSYTNTGLTCREPVLLDNEAEGVAPAPGAKLAPEEPPAFDPTRPSTPVTPK